MTERHRLDELLPLPLHLDSRVLVLTGAGVSAESGVPTFRDAGGLWNSHPVEKVASPEGFADDPALVWRFYAERRRDAGSVSPNPGHRALAALERTLGPRFLLVTQNVDDLHHKAGSEHPLEIHGNLFVTRCSVCTRRPFRDERAYAEPPLCDACAAQGKRSYLRPHIVWFGEMLDPAHMQRIDAFMRSLRERRHELLRVVDVDVQLLRQRALGHLLEDGRREHRQQRRAQDVIDVAGAGVDLGAALAMSSTRASEYVASMRWLSCRRSTSRSSLRRVIMPSALDEIGRYGTIVMRASSAGLKCADSVGLIASRISAMTVRLLALFLRREPHVGDLVRGEVARQDDDRVLEVDEAPLSVGEHALVEHLVEQVEHVGIGLLALVEQAPRCTAAGARPR
jgi:NAD-dependent deacetylase